MAKLSDIGKDKKREKFDLSRALLTLSERGASPEPLPQTAAPDIGGGQASPVGGLVPQPEEEYLPSLGPAPPPGRSPGIASPPERSLEMAPGIDFSAIEPEGPEQLSSGTLRLPARRGEQEEGKSGTLRKISKGLQAIFPLIAAAGKGAYAADQQTYPNMLGGVGAAAKDIEADELARQQAEMEQQRYADEQREKQLRLKSELEDAALRRQKTEQEIRKAGSEAEKAALEAGQYGTELEQKSQKREAEIRSSLARAALDQARKEIDIKMLPGELQEQSERVIGKRAENIFAKMYIKAGGPVSEARLAAQQAIYEQKKSEMYEEIQRAEMESQRRRDTAEGKRAEAAITRANRPYGGVNPLSAIGTSQRLESGIARAISELEVAGKDSPEAQEALRRLYAERERLEKLREVQPSYGGGSGLPPPGLGGGSPTLGSPDAADAIINRALQLRGR